MGPWNNRTKVFDEAPPDPAMQRELINRVLGEPMDALAHDCKVWADQVFPQRTDASMFLKLFKELGELVEACESGDLEKMGDELADLNIMLLDFARRKGISPAAETRQKLEKNKARTWEVTHLGTMQHVK